MMKMRWIIGIAIVALIAAGTYWLLSMGNPTISDQQADRDEQPSHDGTRTGELTIPTRVLPGANPAPIPSPAPEEGKGRPADATPANPDVKMVDGIKMLRGRTIDGDEVWIPAAPEPEMPKAEKEEEPEFLPAPGQ